MWNHPRTRKSCRIIEMPRSHPRNGKSWKIESSIRLRNTNQNQKARVSITTKHVSWAPFLVLCRTCQKLNRPAFLRCWRRPTSGQKGRGVSDRVSRLPRIQRVPKTSKCFESLCWQTNIGINRWIPILSKQHAILSSSFVAVFQWLPVLCQLTFGGNQSAISIRYDDR